MHKAETRTTVFTMFRFLKPYRFRYFFGLIGQSVLFAGERLFMAYVLMSLTNAMTGRDMPLLRSTIITALAFYAVFIPVLMVPRYIWLSAVFQGLARLRERIFARLVRLPMGYHETRHSGAAMSVMANDVTAAGEAYRQSLFTLVDSAFEAAAAGAFMFLLDWRLSLVTLGCGAVSILAGAVFARPLRAAGHDVQQRLSETSQRFSDLLAGFQVVRAFSLGHWILERFEGSSDAARDAGLKRVRWEAWLSAATSFGFSLIIVPFGFGAYLLMTGQATMGTMVAIVQLSNQVQFFARSVGGVIGRLQSSLAALDRIRAVLAEPCEPERYETGAPDRDTIPGGPAAAFREVTFEYPGGERVLDGLSFEAGRGRVVALAGPSGGGKSTVLKLLLGFYGAASGEVTVFGRPMRSYTLAELRDMMAFVPQDPYLFAGTIEENIALGRPGAGHDEIEAAARAAFAHDFIMEQPKGYQTVVGERGATLSGGQRQRIAIARALLKDAPLLLLDEATSALDAESEAVVQQALGRLMEGRTTLVVAHRLSTIEQADLILVLDGGRVVEQGNHQQLLAQNGLYANLARVGAGQADLAGA